MVRSLGNLVRSLFLITTAAVFGSGCIDENISDDDDSADTTPGENPYVCLEEGPVGLWTEDRADAMGIPHEVSLTDDFTYEDGFGPADVAGYDIVVSNSGMFTVSKEEGNPYASGPHSVEGNEEVVKLMDQYVCGEIDYSAFDQDGNLAEEGTNAVCFYVERKDNGNQEADSFEFPSDEGDEDMFTIAGIPSANPDGGEGLVSYVMDDVSTGHDDLVSGGINVGVYGVRQFDADGVEMIDCPGGVAYNPLHETQSDNVIE